MDLERNQELLNHYRNVIKETEKSLCKTKKHFLENTQLIIEEICKSNELSFSCCATGTAVAIDKYGLELHDTCLQDIVTSYENIAGCHFPTSYYSPFRQKWS